MKGSVEVRYPGGDSTRLPDATVLVARVEPFIQAYVGYTDQDGEFHIPQVSQGRWRLNVCKGGFKTLAAYVMIEGGDSGPALRFTTELDW